MITRIKKYLAKRYHNRLQKDYVWFVDKHISMSRAVNEYRKENQTLCGRIKTLEEQHDIMHNFLVEINKYLVNISNNNTTEKSDGMSINGRQAQGKGKVRKQ